MKARARKAQATAQQRAWASNPLRHFVSAGRLSNLIRRGHLEFSPAIGKTESVRFVVSPRIGA